MYEYKRRAIGVVIIEWILLTIPVVLLGVFCGFAYDEIVESFQRPSSTVVLNTLIISVGLLVPFILNVLLTIGVTKAHPTSLKIWYIVQIILIGLGVLYLLVQLPGVMSRSYDPLKLLAMFILFLSLSIRYKAWSIGVIIGLRDEIISYTKYPAYTTSTVVYTRPITQEV